MISIGATNAARTQVQSFAEPKDLVAEAKLTKADKALKDATEAPLREKKDEEGVKVTFSGAALKALTEAKKPSNDIEDSGLPDNVQQVLKMIRKLKEQIAEKQAELQAVMADKSLSPDEARIKVSNLQGALAQLQASLMTAQTSLAKAMKGLSGEDALKAGSLAMA
ncbi:MULTISPECIES: hypothetical protein [Pseudomonas]|uniref:hypothetical protein n=1 Tax=Pseudomonas TaxID=286 RepID=UPI001C9915A5|nr:MULTISPECIES: hypothetical protein [Pseudomonas]QZP19893.1 hypothetical protein K5K89_21590 [Pseudomonas sp. DR208]UUN87359.1 hypothetical protein LUU92_21240 [Pseudomonas extremorientalis]